MYSWTALSRVFRSINCLPHFFVGKLVTTNSSSPLRLFHCLSKTYTFKPHMVLLYILILSLAEYFLVAVVMPSFKAASPIFAVSLGGYTLFLFVLLKCFLGWELCVVCTRLLTSSMAAVTACNGIKFESVPLGSGRVLLFLLKYFSIEIWNSKPWSNRAKSHAINISSRDENSSKCNFSEIGLLLK